MVTKHCAHIAQPPCSERLSLGLRLDASCTASASDDKRHLPCRSLYARALYVGCHRFDLLTAVRDGFQCGAEDAAHPATCAAGLVRILRREPHDSGARCRRVPCRIFIERYICIGLVQYSSSVCRNIEFKSLPSQVTKTSGKSC